jgi:di/tricarboxylate transporter
MALFIVTGVLTPEEGFSGFNHPANLTLGCMFVISAAIFKSGLIDNLSKHVIRLARVTPHLALIILCLVTVFLSAFINDSAVIAVMIPVGLTVCRKAGINPSKIMMPLSFSALFGGTCTLIGTSTNILVSNIVFKKGLPELGMFEFTAPALLILIIGLTFIFLFSRYLLPARESNEKQLLRESENYICEVELLLGNKDILQTIETCQLTTVHNVQILGIKRNKKEIMPIGRHTILMQGDVIKIMINPAQLAILRSEKFIRLKGEHKSLYFSKQPGRRIFELLIPADSPLSGKTLKEINFRNVYNASVIAIRHRDETITQKLSDLKLRDGDMVLVYGDDAEIRHVVEDNVMILLSDYTHSGIDYKKAIPAIIVAFLVITTAAMGAVDLLTAAMVGGLVLILLTTLSPKEAYEAIDWKVIFMVAGVLSMGTALEKTGGSELISQSIYQLLGHYTPHITLSLIFLITLLSTNILSSKATVALMTPIVIELAQAMHVNYKPMIIAVMFACSLTFMTPNSYTTNMMVFTPGNYKYTDYLRFGGPLNLIIWIAASLIIPWFFPF